MSLGTILLIILIIILLGGFSGLGGGPFYGILWRERTRPGGRHPLDPWPCSASFDQVEETTGPQEPGSAAAGGAGH
jgi:hypothetical protein